MPITIANNATSTLASGINDSTTTITVASGEGALFPSTANGVYYYCTLEDTSKNREIVLVTARAADVFTVVRARDATTARAFTAGSLFSIRPNKAAIDEYIKANAETAAIALSLAL